VLFDAAANFLGSKPVREGRGAMVMLRNWMSAIDRQLKAGEKRAGYTTYYTSLS